MTRINQIWKELERDTSFSHGIIYRRYSPSILPDLYIGLKNPEKLKCIAATINEIIQIDLSRFSNLKDINVEVRSHEIRRDKKNLLLILVNNQHEDIFSILCEDLITSISTTISEYELIRVLLNRFEKWKMLFDKASSQGLTAEEQRGLFGELFFLRKFLQNTSNFINVINSWVGSEREIRDFQSGSWAVEVTTTQGNNHQKVHISSERQLDIRNLEDLFLNHLSLDIRQQSGETLNQIIESILQILISDFISLNRFKSKLLEGGYFDQHQHLYENTGYFIRQETFYKVENDFPRIEERDIRNGVGDVKYSIILSQCSQFLKSEQELFQTINFYE